MSPKTLEGGDMNTPRALFNMPFQDSRDIDIAKMDGDTHSKITDEEFTARFENDFRTIDSKILDNELKLIKRIYDNFNKH